VTKWAWLIGFIVVLGGCNETVPTKPDQKPDIVVEKAPKISPEEAALYALPVRKRVTKAIQLLEQGNSELARKLLDSALEEQPDNRTAKRLVAQLDADPEKALGKASYTYRVRPGESLSIIAKRLLNDPLKFVILARYNHIDNPSLLSAGQRLRIPGRQAIAKPAATQPKPQPDAAAANTVDMPEVVAAPPEAPAATPVPEAPAAPPPLPAKQDKAASASKLAVARQLFDAGNYAVAISTLEGILADEPGNSDAQSLLVKALRTQAKRKIQADKLEDAKDLLEKALNLAPTDDDLLTQLTNVDDQLEARALYESGKSLAAKKQYEQAYDALSQALIYDPDLKDAARLQGEIKDKLIEQYHRKAMSLFREQRLDDAISYWDKVLKLDPANTLAPGYRARALELKQKLQHLGK